MNREYQVKYVKASQHFDAVPFVHCHYVDRSGHQSQSHDHSHVALSYQMCKNSCSILGSSNRVSISLIKDNLAFHISHYISCRGVLQILLRWEVMICVRFNSIRNIHLPYSSEIIAMF